MKPKLMRIINWLLYVGFCALIGTGLLLSFRLLPGSRGGRGLELLGWGRHDWGDVHLWIACGVIALTIVHLAQNWAWVKKVANYSRNWRMVIGFGVGLVIIAAFMFLPITRSQGAEGMGFGFGHEQGTHGGYTP